MAFYFMPGKTVRHAVRDVTDRGRATSTMVPVIPPALMKQHRGGGWAARLLRHLRWVIGIKLLLIYLLFSLFFSSSQRPAINADRVSDRLQLTR